VGRDQPERTTSSQQAAHLALVPRPNHCSTTCLACDTGTTTPLRQSLRPSAPRTDLTVALGHLPVAPTSRAISVARVPHVRLVHARTSWISRSRCVGNLAVRRHLPHANHLAESGGVRSGARVAVVVNQ
jgi:hypothetical protein